MGRLELVTPDTARCSKCSEIKDLDSFRTVNNKRRLSGPGHGVAVYRYKLSYCRACQNSQLAAAENVTINYLNRRFKVLQRRCQERGDPFNLTLEYWIQQFGEQGGLCFYSDEPLKWELGSRKYNRECMSVDKIIPALGYVIGNVVFCSYRLNTMKNDCTLDEMRRWMPEWHRRVMNKLEKEKIIWPASVTPVQESVNITASTAVTA